MHQLDTSGLAGMLNGYQLTQTLYVAAKLGIADLLANSPRHVDELAEATSTHAPSLYRLLKVLSGFGVFVEKPGRVFEAGSLAVYLQQNSHCSLRTTIILRGEDYYRTWGELLFSIQTGKPSFERVFGMSNWEYRRANPQANARFNAFMSEMAQRRSRAVLAAWDFGGGVIVDVGGGDGTLLRAILQRNQNARGILFDQPHVIEQARGQVDENELDRCQHIAGDFFTEVPSGGDTYILSAVLHDWCDDDAVKILQGCRAAMSEKATLVIIERVIPGNEASPALLADLDMLVNNGGCERDERSWKVLLEDAELRLISSLPTSSAFHILRAVRTDTGPDPAAVPGAASRPLRARTFTD